MSNGASFYRVMNVEPVASLISHAEGAYNQAEHLELRRNLFALWVDLLTG
jgi:hypothetical protein